MRVGLLDWDGAEIASCILSVLPQRGDVLEIIADGKQVAFTVDRVQHRVSKGASDGSVFRKHVYGAQEINIVLKEDKSLPRGEVNEHPNQQRGV